jgi:hypothetical protein
MCGAGAAELAAEGVDGVVVVMVIVEAWTR